MKFHAENTVNTKIAKVNFNKISIIKEFVDSIDFFK